MTQYVDGSLYYYAPNKVAPIAFAVLFFISGVIHFYQTFRYGSWIVTGLMPWGAILLTAGFCLREYGAYHYKNVDFLVANTVLIMSGPPVYALINYMVLSRILYYVPYLSPLHPGRVLTTFLAADGICEILIANGAQRMVNPRLGKSEREAGAIMVKVALILQACLFVLFICLGVTFQRRAIKAKVIMNKKLRTVLMVMYVSCVIITARCIYRIVEFFQGYIGEVYTHEVYFYVFEASIMFINTAMLNVWHPGRYLPSSNKVFLSQDGETELRGPGWKESRPFLVTVIDPFDLWGLATGRDKRTRFWELLPEQLSALVDEEDRKRQEQIDRPRKVWEKVLDPLHLFGAGGKFMMVINRSDDAELQRRNVKPQARTVSTESKVAKDGDSDAV